MLWLLLSEQGKICHPENLVANLGASTMQMGVVSMCLQDFAAQIISHVIRGDELDDASLAKIKATAIHRLKDVELQSSKRQKFLTKLYKSLSKWQMVRSPTVKILTSKKTAAWT